MIEVTNRRDSSDQSRPHARHPTLERPPESSQRKGAFCRGSKQLGIPISALEEIRLVDVS